MEQFAIAGYSGSGCVMVAIDGSEIYQVDYFGNRQQLIGKTASATAAAADDALDLNITALVRQVCCAAGSALTLVLTGAAASVDNVALRVQRI